MSRTFLALALACALTACHSAKDTPEPDAGNTVETDADVPTEGDAAVPPEGDAEVPIEGDADVPPGEDGGSSAGEVRVSVPPEVFCAGSCYDVRVGDTLQLIARDELDATLTPDSWSTSDAQIAAVSGEGLVEALAPGDVEVVATVGEKQGSVMVHVLPRPAARVVIEPASIELDAAGDTVQLTATAYDDQDQVLPNLTFFWFSANEQVATVDESGKLTATGRGAGIIYVGAESGGEGSATVVVGGLISDAPALELTAIAGSMNHDCGVMADGKAYCWGWNYWGQLGTGTRGGDAEYFPTPLPVQGDHVFHGLTGSSSHTCAIDDSDAAYCWGSNGSGELGVSDPEVGGITVPIAVEGGLKFAQVSAGYDHTCALQVGTGKAYCFGLGGNGAVGDGAFEDKNNPSLVAHDGKFVEVEAGYDTSCALSEEGQAYCWGDNRFGQIGDGGDGETSSYGVPTAVVGEHTFVDLDLFSAHACALTKSGEAWCWGRNESAQLGNGTDTLGESTPVKVSTDESFVSITVGVWHSCGLTKAGDVHCWGLNASGQLGNATVTSSPTPVKVAGGLTFRSVEAGGFHTCGITDSGRGYCWGENGDGRLGSGFGGEGSISLVPWPVAAPDAP